ncbi:MAG: hypothetical protein FJY15_00470 [Bacteroidetes bacterium]|nr:hypothetical protein [Bacteroidota bacterium]
MRQYTKYSVWMGLLLMLLFISGCEKDERLYTAPDVPVGIQSATFTMGDNYENQVWFEFSTQKTASNAFGIWDIGFSWSEKNNIIINTGKHSAYAVTYVEGANFRDFSYVDVSKHDWIFDNPNGHLDSLSFSGCWESYQMGKAKPKDRLYIINRGADSLGSKKFIKLKMLGREGASYHFQWGSLTDTVPHDVYISTKNDYNFAYFSFSDEKEVFNEPFTRDNWDMIITTYKQTVTEETLGITLPYILRGVLTNPNKVKVLELNNIVEFNAIDLKYAKALVLSDFLNEIGYDWKTWSLTANKYTVNQKKIFIILDAKGNYFKMRFVDFYNDKGEKGYPKIVWELLK